MCYIVAYVERSQHPGGYQASPRDIYRTQIYYDDYDMDMVDSNVIGCPGLLYQAFISYASISHPLLEYVIDHGFEHLAHVNPRNQTVLRAIMGLQLHVEQHPSKWTELCQKAKFSFTRWPTLKHDLVLYILIAFAPEPMLRHYFDRVAPKLKDGTNPLIYAAYFSEIEHCRTLLSRGVSLDRSGWHVDGSLQVLPIEVAARRAEYDVVDLFLRAGSPIPHKVFVSALEEPFWKFPACNVARLLQTDEFVEWATHVDDKLLLRASDSTRYSVVYEDRPSEKDIDLIQRRLVQIDCDPYTRFNEESLRTAVSIGHISTVKHMLSLNVPLPHDIILDASYTGNSSPEMITFLLGRGRDAQVTRLNDGSTPLHLIMTPYYHTMLAEDVRLKIVQVLVDAGCSPSKCNLVGETPLYLATMYGYTSIIKYFLSLQVQLPPDILLAAAMSTPSMIHFIINKGADLHAIAADGNTPLHVFLNYSYPAWDRCLDGVKILVNAGCNPFLPNAFGETPLDIAAKFASPMVVQYFLSLDIPSLPPLLSVCGNPSQKMSPMIEFLISKGADIHSTYPNGDTPLHLAIKADSEVECLRRLEILVNSGCDPHACDLAGKTPFHIAARHGHILVMEYLLSVGVSIPSDVMLTLFGGNYWIERCYPTICFLLDKGADGHVVSEDGETPLHFAAALNRENEALDVVKLLVHSGCNLSMLNSARETPLHIAARRGYLSVVDYLLSLGTPFPRDMLLAASDGPSQKTQMIRYLVDRGADASVATADGDTPLHLLLTMGTETDRLESTKILIDTGCDPCARNLAGETPLHTAARSGLVTILKYLSLQGKPLPRDILRASSPATIIFLLTKGSDLCSVSMDDDKELIHHALHQAENTVLDEENCLECTQILVDLGLDLSLRNSSGETLMHVATRNGQMAVIKYLLSQRVPLPADVLVAVTPKARVGPYLSVLELVRFLICEGASVNITAPNGDTPLHLALKRDFTPDMPHIHILRYYTHADDRRHHSWELVELLLNHGSDPTARNIHGQTPFDLADAQGHFFKANFLRLVHNSRVQLPRMSV